MPFVEPECQQYFNEGRLLLVQGLRGKGERNVLIYGLYGHAGSRWDADKKKTMDKILNAISRDMAARGPQIICVVGDFNLQPHESDLLQTYLRTRFLYDAVDWRQPGTEPEPTCHKGTGTRIDLIMMNSQAGSRCQHYQTLTGFNVRDHSEIQVTLRIPLLAQHRHKIFPAGNEFHYDPPPVGYQEHHPVKIPQCILDQIDKHDIDAAFQAWCSLAQQYLCMIPQTTEHGVSYDTGDSRGRVRIQRQVVFPKSKTGEVQNLHSRRLARALALARAEGLTRVHAFGEHQVRAWGNINTVKLSLSPSQWDLLASILNQTPTQERARDLVQLSRMYLQQQITADRNARIKAWKKKITSNEKYAYQWAKGHKSVEDQTMTLPDGRTTVNEDEQLRHIAEAWRPIFSRFSTNPPDTNTFMQQFGEYMVTAPMDVKAMIGALLVANAKNITPSSCSLDQWRPDSLKALALWFPSLYGSLGVILRYVEATGTWREPLTCAYLSLIPKDSTKTSPAPAPTDFRPISVLSAIYRLWSSTRFKDCMAWQESWAHSQMWGCRRGRGAEAMGMDAAIQLEEIHHNSNLVAGGLCVDFMKCFDLIPENLLFQALQHRGNASMHPSATPRPIPKTSSCLPPSGVHIRLVESSQWTCAGLCRKHDRSK